MKHAVLVSLLLSASALAMPDDSPNQALDLCQNRSPIDEQSRLIEQVLEYQKKCKEMVWNDDDMKNLNVDQAGQDAICDDFVREAFKCQFYNDCMDRIAEVAEECLKSTKKSAKQSGGKFADLYLGCFQNGIRGEQGAVSAEPLKKMLSEAVQAFNSCKEKGRHGCDRNIRPAANNYVHSQLEIEELKCSDNFHESTQECKESLYKDKKEIDRPTEKAFHDCVKDRLDATRRDKGCITEN